MASAEELLDLVGILFIVLRSPTYQISGAVDRNLSANTAPESAQTTSCLRPTISSRRQHAASRLASDAYSQELRCTTEADCVWSP